MASFGIFILFSKQGSTSFILRTTKPPTCPSPPKYAQVDQTSTKTQQNMGHINNQNNYQRLPLNTHCHLPKNPVKQRTIQHIKSQPNTQSNPEGNSTWPIT
jgi:hypothetical protein